MSDGDAMLRAILDRPADDTARLVYADWLTEKGEGHRAEFIRVQVELGRLGRIRLSDMQPDEWIALASPLKNRAEELFYRHRDQWFPVPSGYGLDWMIEFRDAARNTEGRPGSYGVHRGFVSEIHLPLSAFMRHAETLFRSHPIERVTLTDREPLHLPRVYPVQAGQVVRPADRWEWHGTVHTDIDRAGVAWDIWRSNPMIEKNRSNGSGHELGSPEESLDWLSQLCVDYGRKLAELHGG